MKVFFNTNEILDVEKEAQVDDEVEFTIVQVSYAFPPIFLNKKKKILHFLITLTN